VQGDPRVLQFPRNYFVSRARDGQAGRVHTGRDHGIFAVVDRASEPCTAAGRAVPEYRRLPVGTVVGGSR
jgi:hypothetical protein